MRRTLKLATATALILFLAACDTAEERAEEHFESALTLIENEDFDRAIVELRNVFTLVPNHLEARHTLARVLREDVGDPARAYRQYLRLAEQYPEDLEARIALSEIAFSLGNWDELERHGEKAVEIAPDNPKVVILSLALSYQDSIAEDQPSERRAIAERAKTLLAASPDNRVIREIILDNHLRESEFADSLAMLDILTTEFPEEQRYWRQRLQVLIQTGDEAAIEAQLIDLVARFPEDVEQKSTLVRYYLSRQDLDSAEAFLRAQVDLAGNADNRARVDLVRFLTELRSLDAAQAEIALAIDEADDPLPFIVLGAALNYTNGNPDEAIMSLEELIDGAEPSEEINDVKITLAKMLLGTGNEVGARALVEGVLLEDATQTEALKMSAQWLIQRNDADNAIAALRAALDQDPEDAQSLSLMAEAYLRTGSRDLARDFLSLAAEASGNAPEETVRYARVLMEEERYLPAEDALLPALRIAPTDLSLLTTIGELYLAMNDLGRVNQVVDTLRRIETPEAERLANRFEAERLNRESGSEEAIAFLENVAREADGDLSSQLLLVRARIASGDGAGALMLTEQLLAESPDDSRLKTILASTAAITGDLPRAESIYRDLVAEFPDQAGLWIQIAQLRARQEDQEGSREAINTGLETNPTDSTLLWAKASYLEGDGDIDAAIEVYEELYERNTASVVIANNLASLIATYRQDDESLDRAWNIARRFRDTEVPALQDTYGWIAHRRGDSEEALDYLTGAAAGLPEDPIVQFHLAEVLFATGQTQEALAQYRKVLDLAGATDSRDQIATARARIQEIESQDTTDQ